MPSRWPAPKNSISAQGLLGLDLCVSPALLHGQNRVVRKVDQNQHKTQHTDAYAEKNTELGAEQTPHMVLTGCVGSCTTHEFLPISRRRDAGEPAKHTVQP